MTEPSTMKTVYKAVTVAGIIILGLVFLLGRASVDCHDPELRMEIDSVAIKSVRNDIEIALSKERERLLRIQIDTLMKNAKAEPTPEILHDLTRTYRGIPVQSIADSLLSRY